MFGCNNKRLFPEKYTVKFSFARKARVNTERVPPGHPIIPLKSNKFNMAAISVKRSIENFDYREIAYPPGVLPFKSDRGVRRRISRTPPKGTRILFYGRVGQQIGSIFACAGKAVDQKSKQASSPWLSLKKWMFFEWDCSKTRAFDNMRIILGHSY